MIEKATSRLLDGSLTVGDRTQACGEAHKLAGSIGTFGFHAATRLAREVEQLLDGDRPLGAEEASHLAEISQRLRLEVDQAAASPPRDAPKT